MTDVTFLLFSSFPYISFSFLSFLPEEVPELLSRYYTLRQATEELLKVNSEVNFDM